MTQKTDKIPTTIKPMIKSLASSKRVCPWLIEQWVLSKEGSFFTKNDSFSQLESSWTWALDNYDLRAFRDDVVWKFWNQVCSDVTPKMPKMSSSYSKTNATQRDCLLADENLQTLFKKLDSKNIDFGKDIDRILIQFLFQTDDLSSMTFSQFLTGVQAMALISDGDYRSSSPFESNFSIIFASCRRLLLPRDEVSKALYVGCYDVNITYNLSTVSSDHGMSKKYALLLWKRLLPLIPSFTTNNDWQRWVKAQTNIETISRDLWINLYDFAITMKDDYEENFPLDRMSSWHSVLDRFVIDFLDLEEY